MCKSRWKGIYEELDNVLFSAETLLDSLLLATSPGPNESPRQGKLENPDSGERHISSPRGRDRPRRREAVVPRPFDLVHRGR